MYNMFDISFLQIQGIVQNMQTIIWVTVHLDLSNISSILHGIFFGNKIMAQNVNF